jgi:ubiquinone/menaquinone biosynthesis C-methylase UbiE
MFFKSSSFKKQFEGYAQNDKFVFKKGVEVYDDFYATIYDQLVFSNLKDDYEITQIINKTKPSKSSVILDVGSGTGHHVAKLAQKNLNVTGIDISQSMINEAKTNYPNYDFKVGNVLNTSEFNNNTFTHILCLYFTIYYLDDKQQFFNNCMEWLMPGGYIALHLVDRKKFDPILPPGNPLYVVSPQKYAKERITNTKITFDDFVYTSNFDFNEDKNIAVFDEKFKFKDGKVRKQEQVLYMEDTDAILETATNAGFIIQARIDLVNCAYENQYIYILTKPN